MVLAEGKLVELSKGPRLQGIEGIGQGIVEDIALVPLEPYITVLDKMGDRLDQGSQDLDKPALDKPDLDTPGLDKHKAAAAVVVAAGMGHREAHEVAGFEY